MNDNPQYFIPISFTENAKAYFFSHTSDDLAIDDFVIVETIKGSELGRVVGKPEPLSKFKGSLSLKPIIAKATKNHIEQFYKNKEDAKIAFTFCEQQIKTLKLPMVLLNAEYTLDQSKLSFTYVAENRVDFRELLKILASTLKTRIELRQIGSRDKARVVGGLGICGLPLCCSTFLHEFDGISINRAKNQMLSLNIPKLSGHCGKLICCLKFEDDVYTDAKKDFPPIGSKFTNDNNASFYRLNSFNVISRDLRLENQDGYLTVKFEEFKTKWKTYNDQKK